MLNIEIIRGNYICNIQIQILLILQTGVSSVFFVAWLFAPMSMYWAQDSICCNKSGFDDHLQIRFEHVTKNVKIKDIFVLGLVLSSLQI